LSFLENITFKQCLKIKISITNTHNYLNRVFPSFDFLNSKFFPELRLIDIFSSHLSFYKANHCNKENKAAYHYKLDDLVLNISSDSYTAIVVSNTSIKNNIATLIACIYSFSSPIKKILYHAVDITMIEAELFIIRCRINQAVQISDFSYIIIIIDTIYM